MATGFSCATCENYKSRHADAAAEARAAEAGHPVPPGVCWRDLTPVARQQEDCCSGHSELVTGRLDYLAERIAALLNASERG